jgi:hypothetical protein
MASAVMSEARMPSGMNSTSVTNSRPSDQRGRDAADALVHEHGWS